MPLSLPTDRNEVHHRAIDMKAFARADGLFDIESRLVDRKPFDFQRFGATSPWPAGSALHDMGIRLTLDGEMVIRAVEATMDATPFDICSGATPTLSVLVGEKIGRGWSKRVKELLGGAASCTHLMELLIPMATAALQGVRAVDPKRITDIRQHSAKIDSCFAYSRNRAMVQRLWPQHYQEPGESGTA